MGVKLNCGNCRYWLKHEAVETNQGQTSECRRRAPGPATDTGETEGQDMAFAFWPYTFADDWCGEHSIRGN